MFENAKEVVGAALLRLANNLDAGAEAKAQERLEKLLASRLDTVVALKVSDALRTVKQEEAATELAKRLKEVGRSKRLVAFIAIVGILLALGGVAVFCFVPDGKELREGMGYLAYLFPLYAVLIAGRALIVNDVKANPEKQAVWGFIDSLIFLVAGVSAQIAYQSETNACGLFFAASVILGLLVLSFIGHVIYYVLVGESRWWVALLELGFVVFAFGLTGYSTYPIYKERFTDMSVSSVFACMKQPKSEDCDAEKAKAK